MLLRLGSMPVLVVSSRSTASAALRTHDTCSRRGRTL
jgi:hypothetical protein